MLGKSVPSFFDLITPKRVVFLQSSAKDEVLRRMVSVLAADHGVPGEEAFRRAIFEREALMTTALGIGIAVPHARIPANCPFALALGLHTEGIEFGALDEQPVQVAVMIAQPDGAADPYLEILAQVATFLKNPGNFNAILGAPDAATVVEIVRKAAPR